MIMTKF